MTESHHWTVRLDLVSDANHAFRFSLGRRIALGFRELDDIRRVVPTIQTPEWQDDPDQPFLAVYMVATGENEPAAITEGTAALERVLGHLGVDGVEIRCAAVKREGWLIKMDTEPRLRLVKGKDSLEPPTSGPT